MSVIKFTLPLDKEVAVKMRFISKYYGRSRAKEIEWACKEWIRAFEKEHGQITSEDLRALADQAGE